MGLFLFAHMCALQTLSAALQELISTASEALNSVMQRLHSQTPYMTQETYIDVVQGIMGVRNALLNRSLRKICKAFEQQ